jgi:hypothetical protein
MPNRQTTRSADLISFFLYYCPQAFLKASPSPNPPPEDIFSLTADFFYSSFLSTSETALWRIFKLT